MIHTIKSELEAWIAYKNAKESFTVANYASAIEQLGKVVAMDETYADGKALLLLGHSYALASDKEKSAEKYNRIIELFPNTEIAKKADEGLKGNIPTDIQMLSQ
ncbi:MAG: hypothetical protein RR791_04670 [Lachnospiraceae bacterium]